MTVFKGYAVKDPKKWDQLEIMEFQPKNWDEDDVEIAITHCGVCGSDLHTINGGWGDQLFPLIVGHEIVGVVTRIGSNVTTVKVGDRAGVGAQCNSCNECYDCEHANENYCHKWIDTYGDKHKDGVKTMGGYSTAIIATQRFVFPIPDGLESKHAASMLCAGLTVYSPLVRNGAGPGKTVGVIGIGGLGHYAILFAKALGATVVAFTHSSRKVDDIKALGADIVVETSNHSVFQEHKRALDLIICTRDKSSDMPIADYVSMLKVHGSFISVGLPDEPLPPINVFSLLKNGSKVGSSHLGNRQEALDMLQLAADKGIKPWVEEMPMKDVATALHGVEKGKVKYRYVLTQDLA